MLNIQIDLGMPKIKEHVIDDTTSYFEVSYFPRGFGHTIGNSIRRFILSYQAAGAITAVVIKDVPFEYTPIDGVKESALDLVLNFKKLRFKIDKSLEKVNWVKLSFNERKKYYGKDLVLPSGIEVLNPDVYLFELTDKSIDIDIRVEKGYGYYSLDFLKKRELEKGEIETGLILIDNDFKVTDYVTYEVEEVIDDFIGGIKEKVIIKIKTISNLIKPRDLITFAGEVLSSYYRLFIYEDAYVDEIHFENNVEKMIINEEIKVNPIDILQLSERTRNALIKNNILYIEDLVKKSKAELVNMKGIGKKAVEEIEEALSKIGKSLQ